MRKFVVVVNEKHGWQVVEAARFEIDSEIHILWFWAEDGTFVACFREWVFFRPEPAR